MIIVLLGILIIVAFYCAIRAIIEIFEPTSKPKYPKLSYKQFVDYYWVNPDKWSLENNYVNYIYFDKEAIKSPFLSGAINKKFSFSFIDMLKYRKFKHYIKANKEKQYNLKADKEAYQILLNGVQEDIDKLRKQSENELNQAMNTMKKVKERIV